MKITHENGFVCIHGQSAGRTDFITPFPLVQRTIAEYRPAPRRYVRVSTAPLQVMDDASTSPFTPESWEAMKECLVGRAERSLLEGGGTFSNSSHCTARAMPLSPWSIREAMQTAREMLQEYEKNEDELVAIIRAEMDKMIAKGGRPAKIITAPEFFDLLRPAAERLDLEIETNRFLAGTETAFVILSAVTIGFAGA